MSEQNNEWCMSTVKEGAPARCCIQPKGTREAGGTDRWVGGGGPQRTSPSVTMFLNPPLHTRTLEICLDTVLSFMCYNYFETEFLKFFMKTMIFLTHVDRDLRKFGVVRKLNWTNDDSFPRNIKPRSGGSSMVVNKFGKMKMKQRVSKLNDNAWGNQVWMLIDSNICLLKHVWKREKKLASLLLQVWFDIFFPKIL